MGCFIRKNNDDHYIGKRNTLKPKYSPKSKKLSPFKVFSHEFVTIYYHEFGFWDIYPLCYFINLGRLTSRKAEKSETSHMKFVHWENLSTFGFLGYPKTYYHAENLLTRVDSMLCNPWEMKRKLERVCYDIGMQRPSRTGVGEMKEWARGLKIGGINSILISQGLQK